MESYMPDKSAGILRMDKKRILIADDQPDVLEALRFLLKAEGYQIERSPRPPPSSTRWRPAISTR